MPTVKGYERQVDNAPLRGGEKTAALSEVALGGGIGETVAKFGAQIHRDEIERQDQVAFMEADRKLGEWENKALYDPQNGALNKKGKDAFGVPDAVAEDYRKNVDAISQGLGNDRQKAAFTKAANARGADLQRTLSRHVFTEARQYEAVETENYIKNASDTAALNYDNPDRVDLEINKGRAAIVDFAKRNGLGAEYEKQKTSQFVSNTHIAIIGRYLSNGQDLSAQKYFEEAKSKGLIAGDDLEKVEGKLKHALTEGQGLRGAAEIWDKSGPKSDLDPVQTDVMMRQAEKTYADNPTVLKAVKQGIIERAQIHNASQRERMEGAASNVWGAIEKGASFAGIRTMADYRTLPGKQQNEIKTWMIDRADTLKRRADQDGDDTLYYNLITEASSNATSDKFATTNLLEYRTKLSKQQFQTLVGVQAAIRKGDDKEQNKLLASERVQKNIVDEALLSMKLDPTPNEKTSTGKIEQINGFRRSVREAVSAQEARTGKNATDKEVQSIVDGLIIKGVTKAGVLWDDTKRVYELKPGENITIKVTDVPKADRAKIEDSLKRAGQPVTPEAVTSLYRARLLKIRGDNAPNPVDASGKIK